MTDKHNMLIGRERYKGSIKARDLSFRQVKEHEKRSEHLQIKLIALESTAAEAQQCKQKLMDAEQVLRSKMGQCTYSPNRVHHHHAKRQSCSDSTAY